MKKIILLNSLKIIKELEQISLIRFDSEGEVKGEEEQGEERQEEERARRKLNERWGLGRGH